METASKELHASRASTGQLSKEAEAWQTAHSKFEADYAGAKERSTAHISKLTELSVLETRRKELAEAVAEQREELKRIGDPSTQHSVLRAQWIALQSEGSKLVESQCAVLTKASDGLIRATLERSTGLNAVTDKFKAAIAGSGVRSNKIEAFTAQVGDAENPLAAWHEALDSLEGYLLSVDDPTAKRWVAKGALTAFAGSDVEKMAGRISPEEILELSLTSIGDRPVFEYQIKEGEYISFEVASAGQQATALLRVLLHQAGPPLLIDQPEDDLDSQVILDVVDQIWTAKTRRQLIFSSHNANLVVNGDAELVACCDYRAAGDQSGGRIKLEGAIDIPKVRDEITTVMEGGEKAFRMRKEKYGF
jgi:chromosome segregation protein